MTTVGEFLTPDNNNRDAIHIAVIPVRVYEDLFPGTPVKFVSPGAVEKTTVTDSVGIIDPFLPRKVKYGEKVYLFLKPNMVTDMRHEWRCPVIDVNLEEHPVIAEYTNKMGMTYPRFMEVMGDYYDEARESAEEKWFYPEDQFKDNTETYKDLDWDKFWVAFEQATGNKVLSNLDSPFYCSC